MTDLDDRLRAASRASQQWVVGHPRVSPADAFAALGAAAEELGVEEWDSYGDRGPVEMLEREVADLLGKPAAVFFVSGVTAQQVALRIWCDRQASQRVAIPDLSHLLVHEEDGPRLLHGFRFEPLTRGPITATAADLAALPGRLGAALVELPLRDAACRLPTWDELVALSEAARERGVPLHVDGARLWESQPFYDRPLAEIAGLADSVYVSFYKGLGGLAGAAVVGPEDVMAEARIWRRRMGGTLFRMSPYALSALIGLRDRLPQMAEYVAWARSLAAELVDRGLRVNPDPPHTNTFQLFVPGEAERILERTVDFMERELVDLCWGWRPAESPGTCWTEVTVLSGALDFEPEQVAGWFAGLVED
ncbi:beta-eliminating lyase-related protein [Nocardioides sp.]|uniref:threonine aldolase family protein n=1 Tax=Nocardioides sp. TaxID=35761 RepID=UPI0031FEB3DB|nr:threonine aldolase [Nocardioides sp.]